jgi:shikimate dehydrogenase
MHSELVAMTLKAAVLGSPISHSLSPILHRAAYTALGLDIDYTAIDTPTEMLAQRIEILDDNSLGYSLTMPLKREVLALVEHQSRLVQQTRCANTVFRNREQNWALENTDVFGIVQTIKNAGLGPLKSASIIGSGATASSSLSALAQMEVGEVTCYARNETSFLLLRSQSELLGVDFQSVTLVDEITIAGDIVISTVPSSAQKQFISMLDSDQGNSALLDIAYNPWPSDLAKYWTAHQLGPVLSGVEMLLWQACAQVELFTGEAAPVAAMRAALPMEFSTV